MTNQQRYASWRGLHDPHSVAYVSLWAPNTTLRPQQLQPWQKVNHIRKPHHIPHHLMKLTKLFQRPVWPGVKPLPCDRMPTALHHTRASCCVPQSIALMFKHGISAYDTRQTCCGLCTPQLRDTRLVKIWRQSSTTACDPLDRWSRIRFQHTLLPPRCRPAVRSRYWRPGSATTTHSARRMVRPSCQSYQCLRVISA